MFKCFILSHFLLLQFLFYRLITQSTLKRLVVEMCSTNKVTLLSLLTALAKIRAWRAEPYLKHASQLAVCWDLDRKADIHWGCFGFYDETETSDVQKPPKFKRKFHKFIAIVLTIIMVIALWLDGQKKLLLTFVNKHYMSHLKKVLRISISFQSLVYKLGSTKSKKIFFIKSMVALCLINWVNRRWQSVLGHCVHRLTARSDFHRRSVSCDLIHAWLCQASGVIWSQADSLGYRCERIHDTQRSSRDLGPWMTSMLQKDQII